MASQSANAHLTATLTADAADDVTLARQTTIELVHHGDVADPIYFRTDGVTPVAEDDENLVVLAGERLPVRLGADALQLVSAGIATYSVITTG